MKRTLRVVSLLGLALSACNPSAGDPRGAVIKFITAVKGNDTLTVLRGITIEAPYSIIPDTGLTETGPRADTLMVARLMQQIALGGDIYWRWVEQRIVVGDAEIRGDSALVEVTRLNQDSGQQTYNKFGLVNVGGYWRIYSFHTQPGPAI